MEHDLGSLTGILSRGCILSITRGRRGVKWALLGREENTQPLITLWRFSTAGRARAFATAHQRQVREPRRVAGSGMAGGTDGG